MTDPRTARVSSREAALHVVRTLQNAGFDALFAGGCVRDELLGLTPTDYDVATNATPDEIRSLFRSTAHVGAHFGVVIVRTKGHEIEVATFRKDGPYTDKRRPDAVVFATDVEDANRRDFTINALFLDPLAAEDAPSIHGHVIDHVGGQADLASRILRAVGRPEDRLAEDHLRALRAVRFAARFECVIHPDTARAIIDHASDLAGVSPERVGHELRRMLAHPTRAEAVRLLSELGLELTILGNPARPGTLRLAGLPAIASFEGAISAWILDREGPAADLSTYRKALCLSNDEQDLIRSTLESAQFIETRWDTARLAQRKRAAARPGFPLALNALQAVEPERIARIRNEVDQAENDGVGLCPPPVLGGETLIALGYRPGPLFREVLSAIYDAQLEGQLSDEAEARALAQKLMREREHEGGSDVSS